MAQNKRLLRISVLSDNYLAELNKRARHTDAECSFPPCSTHSSVLMTREFASATPQSFDAYLDQLNQREMDSSEGGACILHSDSSASGESCRDQPALGPSVSGSASGESCRPQSAANRVGLSQRRVVSRGGLKLQAQFGSGAFGTVFKCTWQSRELAVKIYRDVERAVHDAARELELLKHLQKHRSVHWFAVCRPGGRTQKVCIIFRTLSL